MQRADRHVRLARAHQGRLHAEPRWQRLLQPDAASGRAERVRQCEHDPRAGLIRHVRSQAAVAAAAARFTAPCPAFPWSRSRGDRKYSCHARSHRDVDGRLKSEIVEVQ